ncbi:MAG TPA: hypothetical protein VFD59_11780 [Nocardioidaceae bacterium]|nr:hypothetical protein [Nocardioidaceae bacterium]
MGRITVQVEGYPPAKNEALSMLGEGHSHARRVRALLSAAQEALAATPDFAPIEHAKIALDVVVRVSGTDPWDATNYLGGIADVLEDKSRRGVRVSHLGELANVWLYRNDRQIRRVTYTEEPGPAGYEVTISTLAKTPSDP